MFFGLRRTIASLPRARCSTSWRFHGCDLQSSLKLSTNSLHTSTSQSSFTVNGEIPTHNPNYHLKTPTPGMSAEETIVTEELLKLFILDEQDSNTFIANHLGDGTWITKNVYGGSLFSQSLIAASKTVAENFVPHAVHSLFILNASTQYPVTYKIQRIRDGRSFCTRYVQAEQNGQIVYTTQISFHVVEAPAISHQISMPQVKPPEECLPTWDIAKNYLDKHTAGELTLNSHQLGDLKAKIAEKDSVLVEVRVVDPDIQFSVTPHSHQTYYYWVRVRATVPPEDRAQHRALAAYLTDATLVSAANRPHISQGFLPSMLVSLDHNTWFHTDDYRTDEWMLYENDSPIADHGRAFSTGRLWRRDGRLILSAAQESLSRTKTQKSSL